MVCCPACGGWPCRCGTCGVGPDGVPDLYVPAPELGEEVATTDRVRAFYEASPFPEYRDGDDIGALVRRARANPFLLALDAAITPGLTVVEAGCGTGQMSMFLAATGRTVVGMDLAFAPLLRGRAFARANGVNVELVRGNLFRPPFPVDSVDVVIANGVLHHTASARNAFAALGRIVKPGGHFIVGLYNRWGRLLLPFYGSAHAADTSARGKAWYADQHQHPHESRHTVDEVLGWLGEDGFSFVSAWPAIQPGIEPRGLFDAQPEGGWLAHQLAQLGWLGRARDGGLWVTVGRKGP